MPRRECKGTLVRPDGGRAFLIRTEAARPIPILLMLGAVTGLVVAATLLTPAEGVLSEAPACGSAAGFHVVVITLDSTRADRLGCYGYDKARTPFLDSLAESGVRFADAVSSAPLTLPAHASMFTGLDPPNHGVRNNREFRLARSATTLAELLRANNYETAAFVSAFDLDARFGLDQGFDHYDADIQPASARRAGHPGDRSAEAVTDAALSWLRSRASSERPYFMWVHYRDPHLPYAAPRAFQFVFPDDPYDAEIAYMDSQIGRLVGGMRDGGTWDKTLVIVAGDHGESLGEHGESDHSLLIYGSTQRVPLLLSCPGLFARSHLVDDVVVGIVDIYPTVLDLLGIAAPNRFDGVSLVRAAGCKDRVIYMETLAPYLGCGWSPLYALRRHHDKFIFAPEREYYALDFDPYEQINLYRDRSPRTLAARTTLEKAMTSYLAEAAPRNASVVLRDGTDDAIRARLAPVGRVRGTVIESYVDALDPKYLTRMWKVTQSADVPTAMGDLEAALSHIRRRLAVSPHDRRSLEQMGVFYARQNRPERAEEAFGRAISIRPNAGLYVAMANVLVAQRKIYEAMESLNRAEVLEPDHGGIFITRGDIFCARGRIEEGMAAFQKAKRIDPYRFGAIAKNRLVRFRLTYGGNE